MKRIFYILTFLIINIPSYCQSDFRPGFYITNQGDTIFGMIDYQGDISNGKTCHFKKDLNSNTIEFLPGSILSYRYTDGKYYVSRQLPNDSSKRYVFMEFLIYGKASVYYHRNAAKEYFFIEKNGEIMEMNNNEVFEYNDVGRKFSKNTNQYIGVLKYYFRDAPSMFEEANNVGFNRASIIKISKKYH